MPKKKAKSVSFARSRIFLLTGLALALILAGEGFLLLHNESGEIRLARWLHFGDPARVTMLVGRQVRRGLEAAGVPRDSLREIENRGRSIDTPGTGPPPVRWRVGLAPGSSLLEANYAITHAVEEAGAVILRGSEVRGRDGSTEVHLRVGFPWRTTHDIVLVRHVRTAAEQAKQPARLALVLFGFSDDDPRTDEAFFDLPQPFAVALSPGSKNGATIFRAARARRRELVLLLPLEPINYPQVNPGPGTLLVSMPPARIAALTRRALEQAGPVTAVANHFGSLATQDMAVMGAIYGELKRARLPFLHVKPVPGALCKTLAAKLGVAYDEPDAVLETETRGDKTRLLDARWNALLKRARARGHLIVMLRATPLTRRWLEKALAPKRIAGIEIVPLEALIEKPVGP